MIDSITATIPVVGQAYTDLRPTISAGSIDEYREQLAEVGRLAGNDAFVHRISQNKAGKEKIIVGDDVLYFDRDAHEYEDEQGNKYWTGSTWAAQFEKPFDPQLIAPKVAEKKLCTVDEVIAGWNMKSEVSLSYGTTVHKALECGIKYNELPNNPHLATLVQTYLDMAHDDEQVSEQFVVDSAHKMCGTIDVLVNNGNKHVTIRDFKTGDIYKKISLTPRAKELWPELENKTISIYQLQLSFYAFILRQQGYKVDRLEIYAESADANWQVVALPVLDIRKALEAE